MLKNDNFIYINVNNIFRKKITISWELEEWNCFTFLQIFNTWLNRKNWILVSASVFTLLRCVVLIDVDEYMWSHPDTQLRKGVF